jgi:hypothetical protein
MEEYGESKEKDYPRGRGYGNDYMRGGEVFGGYGYKERAEYDRPRGEGGSDEEEESETDDDEGDGVPLARRSAGDGDAGRDEPSEFERFPQDERAGGWDIPHDVVEETDPPERSAKPPERAPDGSPDSDGEPNSTARSISGTASGSGAPEPSIEHTFGDTGGNLSHSRSYYVTQAQLQHRLVEKER